MNILDAHDSVALTVLSEVPVSHRIGSERILVSRSQIPQISSHRYDVWEVLT